MSRCKAFHCVLCSLWSRNVVGNVKLIQSRHPAQWERNDKKFGKTWQHDPTKTPGVRQIEGNVKRYETWQNDLAKASITAISSIQSMKPSELNLYSGAMATSHPSLFPSYLGNRLRSCIVVAASGSLEPFEHEHQVQEFWKVPI